jgi:hypothetical protein
LKKGGKVITADPMAKECQMLIRTLVEEICDGRVSLSLLFALVLGPLPYRPTLRTMLSKVVSR